MRTPPRVEPPRLGRAVLLQLLALAAGAMASSLPWRQAKAPPEPPPAPPHKEERRIRVVRIERPPLPKPPPQPASKLQPPPAAKPPPQAQKAEPQLQKTQPSPAPAPRPVAQARIAADSTSVHGVRMRVLVPRSAGDLAAHLRNSGGCLVVSRLVGAEAEVVSVLGIDGARAVERPGPPCSGVPRLLRDAALNDALGDPLGRAGTGPLVLQVLLTDRLHDSARSALRARFGDVSEEEMGRRAAESGYELTCFAEPSGNVRCQ